MKTIAEDFKKTYSEEALKEVLSRAGKHSGVVGTLAAGGHITLTDDHVLVFGLLEILDFKCCSPKYECYTTLTEDQIKTFLLKHKQRVVEMVENKEIEVSSYIGMFYGVFEFLSR